MWIVSLPYCESTDWPPTGKTPAIKAVMKAYVMLIVHTFNQLILIITLHRWQVEIVSSVIN